MARNKACRTLTPLSAYLGLGEMIKRITIGTASISHWLDHRISIVVFRRRSTEPKVPPSHISDGNRVYSRRDRYTSNYPVIRTIGLYRT